MRNVVIRRTTDSDVEAVAVLRHTWNEEQHGPSRDPDFEDRFTAWYLAESPRRLTWVAEVGGHMVGMVNLAVFTRMPRPGRPPSRWGYLGNAFVLEEFRNQGIGRLLLETLLAYATEHDFARVVLRPTERAVPLYRRAGFGPADMLMAKVIDAD